MLSRSSLLSSRSQGNRGTPQLFTASMWLRHRKMLYAMWRKLFQRQWMLWSNELQCSWTILPMLTWSNTRARSTAARSNTVNSSEKQQQMITVKQLHFGRDLMTKDLGKWRIHAIWLRGWSFSSWWFYCGVNFRMVSFCLFSCMGNQLLTKRQSDQPYQRRAYVRYLPGSFRYIIKMTNSYTMNKGKLEIVNFQHFSSVELKRFVLSG